MALLPEHRKSKGDNTITQTTITSTGALSVHSGLRAGRSPKDKRIVYDHTTKDVSFFHLFYSLFILECLVG